jgi:hypothetical protein
MHISFDSLREMVEFVEYFGFQRGPDLRAHHVAIELPPEPETPVGALLEGGDDADDADEPVTIIEDEQIAGFAIPPAPTGEKPTRKRRTKAEIEADKAAALAAAANTPIDGAQPAGEAQNEPQAHAAPPVDANPFAAGAINIAQTVQSAMQAAQPGGTLGGIAAQQGVAITEKTDPVVWIPQRGAAIGQVDALAHMNQCRAFIAANGQQRYQKSFPLAGLTPNVMSYKPEQCALHVAALEWLTANPDA